RRVIGNTARRLRHLPLKGRAIAYGAVSSVVIPAERSESRDPSTPAVPFFWCRGTWVPGLQRTTSCCAAPGMTAEILATHMRQTAHRGMESLSAQTYTPGYE